MSVPNMVTHWIPDILPKEAQKLVIYLTPKEYDTVLSEIQYPHLSEKGEFSIYGLDRVVFKLEIGEP